MPAAVWWAALHLIIALGLGSAGCAKDRNRTARPSLPDQKRLATLDPSDRTRVLQAAERAAKAASPAANSDLALLLHALGFKKEALAAYDRVLADKPRSFLHAYMRAVVLGDLSEDTGAAVESWRTAVQLDPAYRPARIHLAAALIRANDWTNARAESGLLMRSESAEAQAYYFAGRVREAEGDTSGAIQYYVTTIDLAPQYGEALAGLVRVLRSKGMNKEAEIRERALARYRDMTPEIADPMMSHLESARGPAYAALRAAGRQKALGRAHEAIHLYETALRHEPAMASAHLQLASLRLALRRHAELDAQYEAARRAGVNLADLDMLRIESLLAQRRTADAEKFVRDAAQRHPRQPAIQSQFGLLIEKTDKAQAEAVYRRAIALDPAEPTANFGLGRLLVNRDASAAAECFELALRGQTTDDERALTLLHLADALIRQRKRSEALQKAQMARQHAAVGTKRWMPAQIEIMIGKISNAAGN